MQEIKFLNGSSIKTIKANEAKRSDKSKNITIYPITKEFIYENHCYMCKNFLGKDNKFTRNQCEPCMNRISGSNSKNIILNEVQMKNIKVKNIHIENSYNIWNPRIMRMRVRRKCHEQYDTYMPTGILNRSWNSIYIEWILHNIGYYITLPFCKIEKIKVINERCKHVDLEEH